MRTRIAIQFAFAALAMAQQPGQRLTLPQEAAINLPSRPIGPSELLTISVYNQPQLSRTVRVSADGFIRLSMLKDRINAAGMLPGDLETLIATAYQTAGILVDPEITVNIAEYKSHPIQVGGSVHKPLTFQAETPVTLLEALNRAEGLTDTAGAEVLVTKSTVTQRITVKALYESGDQSANITLTGGEEIRVPEAGQIYVVGNVKKPGPFPIKHGEASVLQALAHSEGLLRYSTKKAYIYRREASPNRNEIAVDLKLIMERKMPDVKLQADDIFYIPENEKKRMSMTTLAAILTVGGGAAAYALVVYH